MTKELAARYVALWNEPDAGERGRTIAALWTEGGRHVLQPPEEMLAIAARPGLGLPAVLAARGHAEIEARVASAYDHWVAGDGLTFRGRGDADRLEDVVKLHWEAIGADGACAAVGLSVLLLAPDGRIARDCTFIVG